MHAEAQAAPALLPSAGVFVYIMIVVGEKKNAKIIVIIPFTNHFFFFVIMNAFLLGTCSASLVLQEQSILSTSK